MSAKETILSYFQSGELKGVTLNQLAYLLQIPPKERKRLKAILDELVEENSLFINERGVYGTADALGLIHGKITGNERGFAFLVPFDKEKYPNDFFIPKKNLYGALHGDEVLAEKVYSQSDDECAIVKILSRGYKEIVGTFHKDRHAGYLTPDEKRYNTDIYIPLYACKGVKSGVKAVVEIVDYPFKKSPEGKVIEVLGDEDDFFAEELSIIRSYSLREFFPSAVEAEAQKVANEQLTPALLKTRRDFRDELIVTIDGEDTRDIDDAVSLKKVGDDYLLSVHIADVSHYVRHRSTLDKEAYTRGTSVYFPDSVLPMLPKALSNGICSLNEGEDRLTLSCIMRIDKKGVVKDSEIVEGVIRSTHRMTYTEITKILEKDEEVCKKYADVIEMVDLFAELTRILQKMRNKKGCITLDVKEAKILLTKDNEIIIPDYERAFSHQIIEAFMVIANETVAEYMQSIEAPFIYRIHEKPNPEKATSFRDFAKTLGLNPRFNTDDVHPYDYQNLLVLAKDLPVYSMLNRVMLRSMQKARYSQENVGHFGLASSCYCHFTSPIRRYPDLCIHRIIKEILHGNYDSACEKYRAFVEDAAIQSSECERKATEAEREVDALYMTMYMGERIGEEFVAVVSGVTSFGVFAELPNTIEGLIPIESLPDTYEYFPERFTLKGRTTSFTIGELVRVRVRDVDFYRRRTEFTFLDKYVEEKE